MLTTYIVGCVALIIKPGPDLMCTLATACLKLVSALMLAAGLRTRDLAPDGASSVSTTEMGDAVASSVSIRS